MFLKIVLFISIFFSFGSYSNEKKTYTIKKVENSEYIGKVYTIEKPLLYIDKLSKCNNVDKYIAINTSCLYIQESQYKINEIRNNCNGCLSKDRMPVPLRVKLKEKTILTVVGEYSASINDLYYKFFGGNKPLKILLFIDQDGNYIESPSYVFDSSFGIMDKKISRESKRIMAIKQLPYIVKQICYYEKDSTDFATNKNKIIKMLSDFELSSSINVSVSECNRRGMKKKGITISTKNFNDFLTFYYYKGEWGIFGNMD